MNKEENKSNVGQEKKPGKTLDLGNFVLAAMQWQSHNRDAILDIHADGCKPVLEKLLYNGWILSVFADAIPAEGPLSLKCRIEGPGKTYRKEYLPASCPVFSGTAVFHRKTEVLVIRSDDHGGLWMLLTPRESYAITRTKLDLDRFFIAKACLPPQCPVKLDKARAFKDNCDKHEVVFAMTGSPTVSNLDTFEQECTVTWPITGCSALKCVSNCRAIVNLANWDVSILSHDGDLEINLVSLSVDC